VGEGDFRDEDGVSANDASSEIQKKEPDSVAGRGRFAYSHSRIPPAGVRRGVSVQNKIRPAECVATTEDPFRGKRRVKVNLPGGWDKIGGRRVSLHH